MSGDDSGRRTDAAKYTRNHRRMSDEQIISAYTSGIDCEALSHDAGLHSQTIRKILRDAGVEMRKASRQRYTGKPPEIDEEAAVRRYLAGESGAEIAATFNTYAGRIYDILQRRGVERRSSSGALTRRLQAAQQARRSRNG